VLVIAGCAGCALIAGLDQEYGAAASGSDGGPGGAADADMGDAASSVPASCNALLAAAPATKGHDGVYTIDPDGAGGRAPFAALCQMTLDDGGWTLVGRSSVSVDDFGWRSDAGTLDDLAASYSLGVLGAGIPFHELLLADHAPPSLNVATRAYKLAVPASFFTVNGGTVPTAAVTTLLGDCKPSGGPQMFKHTGVLTRTDSFFFRDIDDPSQHTGLTAGGFVLTYDDCDRGGMLNRAPGLVFVR